MQRDAGGDARAAVGDELARRQLRERLVPRRVHGSGNPAGYLVDRVRLAAVPLREPRVDDHELFQARGSSSAPIVSPPRGLGSNTAGSTSSSPALSGPSQPVEARAPRSRRGRSGAAATRAARPRPCSRTRRRRRPRRSLRAMLPRRKPPRPAVDDARQARAARPDPRRRRGTTPPEGVRQGRPLARAPGCRVPSGSRRTGCEPARDEATSRGFSYPDVGSWLARNPPVRLRRGNRCGSGSRSDGARCLSRLSERAVTCPVSTACARSPSWP